MKEQKKVLKILKKIKTNYKKIDKLVGSLPIDYYDEIYDFHINESSLQHSSQFGLTAINEILDAINQIIINVEENKQNS